MTQKIRWGIFGTGLMAHRFAADIGLSATGALVAVASRTAAKAEAFGHGTQAFASYEALARSDAVDAIYVATPNATHVPLCILALEGGKDVLCEKPIATSTADLRRIMAAAKAARRLCMEGMWTALLPGFRDIANRIARSEIGTLVQGHATLGFAWQEGEGDPITDPALGGGALFDLGIYCGSALNHVMGPVTLVTGEVVRSPSGSIRNATAMMRHEASDGAIAHSTWSASHDAMLANRMEITGTKGRIEVEAPFIQMQAARLWSFEAVRYAATAPAGRSALKSSPLWPKLRRVAKTLRGSGGSAIPSDYGGTGFQFQIDEMGQRIAAGRNNAPAHSLDDSLNALTVLENLSQQKG